MRRFWLIGLFCIVFACAAGRARGPEAALRAYVEAVRARDAGRVYALLGDDIRGRFPDQASFEAFFSQYYEEIAAEAEALLAAQGALRVEAEVRFAGGASALLVREPEGWRIVRAPPPPLGETPLETVQALAMLARQRAAGGLFAPYLSYEAKEEQVARLLSFAALLEEVRETDISRDGTQAVVSLPDGRKLRLKEQQGRWLLYTLPEELVP